MSFLKNVRVFPVINGSVVKYDYFDKSTSDNFGSVEFLSTIKEVFTDDKKAAVRARELFEAPNNLDTHTMQQAIASKEDGTAAVIGG